MTDEPLDEIILYPGGLEELNRAQQESNIVADIKLLCLREHHDFTDGRVETAFKKLISDEGYVGVIHYTLIPYDPPGPNRSRFYAQGIPIKQRDPNDRDTR